VFKVAWLDVVAELTVEEFCEEVETLAAIELGPADGIELSEDATRLEDEAAEEITDCEADEETGMMTDELDDDVETDELEALA